ncbi:MAG: S8 family serine peptidase [Bacteroidia bacterium]|jgi:subtilisin family serine protease|nr:S8 family serine peptidase [Bacteroidia bacterium]
MNKLFLFIAVFTTSLLGAQNAKAPENWFNLSYTQNGVRGVSTERTYTELIKGRKADTVIVAVLDGGVDYKHEDLAPVMWVNRKEIAGNGVDDDKNGYVDDIHGWNFLGNKDGRNVQFDQLELTRQLKPLMKRFKNKTAAEISASEQADYQRYIKLKAVYDKEYAEYSKYLDQVRGVKKQLDGMVADIKKQRGVDSVMYNDLLAYDPSEQYKRIHLLCKTIFAKDQESWAAFQTEIAEGYTQLYNRVNYHLDFDYDSRSIVGDNYEDPSEQFYGNNDIKGPDASHGTHVAGIIAGVRDNNLGIKGVAQFVKIMGVRCVPDGDERDKDVANAIRYAVDNGAQIINMSFGKSYGSNKSVVDDAVRYAQSKGVLLIHAAGNDNKDNDATDNFPNNDFLSGGSSDNWIEVGALSWKPGKASVAPFSNYGKMQVDVFAPGVDINSCKVNGGYIPQSGTSMAAPVCAGVAAVLKAYYPKLTPEQIKQIILNSSDKSLAKKKVVKPGEKRKKVKFSKLSRTGGVVDLYTAFQMAEQMSK